MCGCVGVFVCVCVLGYHDISKQNWYCEEINLLFINRLLSHIIAMVTVLLSELVIFVAGYGGQTNRKEELVTLELHSI